MDKNISDGLPLPQRYGAMLTIVLGLAMAVLDGAIANVALPTIATDLNASPAASIWIVNAYQIAIVIALLPLSFLGDMFGYRRIYKIGLALFTLTSLACALSHSLQMLTLARVAQGLGGAALMSVNTALIRLIFPQRFWGAAWGLTPLWWQFHQPPVPPLRRRFSRSPPGNGCFLLISHSGLCRLSSPCVTCRQTLAGVKSLASISPAPS